MLVEAFASIVQLLLRLRSLRGTHQGIEFFDNSSMFLYKKYNPPYSIEMLSYSSSTTMSSFSSQKSHPHTPGSRTSFKISDLIMAEYTKPFFLGKPCKPLTESIMTKRSGKTLHRWRRIKSAPSYFKCVEKNAGIDRMYRRVNKTLTKDKREGKPREEPNRFKANLFKRALQPDILRYVDTFGVSRYNLDRMMRGCYRDLHGSVPKVYKEWVPAGIDGGQQSAAKLPTMAVKALHTTTVKGPGVSFGGYAAMPKSDNDYYKQLHNSTHRIMGKHYLMREVFNLSEAAVNSINEKKSTLLREVHAKCARFEAERWCGSDDEVYVGEQEDVFEVKIGVYFVPAKGKVYKFLHRPENFPEFFSEVSVGLYIEEAVRGVCGIISVCPEHFCFEMKYCGPNLDAVVKGDCKFIGRNKKAKETCVYNVIMMQSTPGQFTVPLLSGLLREEHKNAIIRDASTAIGVFTIFRKKMLDDIPFFLGELINIVTRLGQQGLVNLDIKAENFVIDGCTGQPKMIDFNIVLPSGHKDPPGLTGVACAAQDFENSPQTPPEYLRGQRCFESSMSFCLAHTLKHILKTLSQSGDFTASSLHTDMKLSEWIARAYDENISDRPAPHMAAVYIGSAFPFEKEVRDLFLKPKHTIACKLDKEKVKN